MGTTEIELKLSLGLAAARKLRRDPAVHAAKQGRARNRKLFAVYFDTEAQDLRRGGSALRIRREGRIKVQTLKVRIEGSGAALQTRREIDAITKADVPDLNLIGDSEARAALSALIGEKDLCPVFATDINRTIWDIAWKDSLIEMVLDEGFVRSGKREVEIREAELELKSGRVSDILDFTNELSRRNQFRISDETKAGRGYRLFVDQPRGPAKARSPKLSADDTAWSAFAACLGSCSDQLIGNQDVVLLGENPEGVHQARVAVRRARALLTAYRPLLKSARRSKLAKRLGWLQVALGPARDWDVFLTETLDPLSTRNPDQKGLKNFRKKAQKARAAAYDTARDAIMSRRYTRLQLRLLSFALSAHSEAEAVSARAHGGHLLDDRLAAVLSLGGDNPRTLPEEQQHELRKEIKRLRYAIEFFEPIHGPDAKPMVKAAKKLQDCLGALNDAVVARSLIAEIAPATSPIDSETESLIQADFAARIARDLDRLAALWATFRDTEPFWRHPA